ncbi:IS5 family transposase [Streptomyces nodosus]|uniref:Transposase n=1 Tax=Streptomyces nodosus TaxID=40318 RepID=A0A0B5DL67_9ACTN|nr:IS5 family transposase [Streptomyces nodosus]AJE43949.1 transposase [Streptomyces nodosus]MBB4795518.1 transposase [Streptomyces nodosus]QEV42450.1 IS5 family transposase [Streptomyces nodosus]
MQPSRPYPSDLSDARWELIRPTLEAWRQARNGIRKPTHDLRTLMNAVLYVDRTGIPWRYLPHDFPPHQTVYGYFAHWEADGIFDQLTGLLRSKVRQTEGRPSEPSACLIDSQSIKTSATVPLTSQGIDPAKKIIGRKRHIVTDTLGLLLAVAVTAASVHDSAAGTQLLARVAEQHPTVTKAWADNGYKTKAVEHAARLGIDLEIVQRAPNVRGFHVLPRRWVIERTLGWLMHHRRLARDYETHPHRSAAMIQLAAINLMTRRLTNETTPNWRDSQAK